MISFRSRELIFEHKKNGFDVIIILHIVFVLLLFLNKIHSFDLALGVVNYETDNFTDLLLHNKFFVDKSLLIEEFLQYDGSLSAQTVVRPKGWGKSINLNMMEKFFEIEVDEKGNPLPKNKTINDKLFFGGTINLSPTDIICLEPLKIAKSSNATKHLGKHPVILLRLKNVTGKNYEEMESKIKSCVGRVFERHKYLTHSSKITNMEKFEKYLKGDFNSMELANSLNFLAVKLREHFGQDVFVLVDDYDIPLVSTYLEFENEQLRDASKVTELLTSMLSGARKKTISLPIQQGINAATTLDYSTLNLTLQNSVTFFQREPLNAAFLTGVLDLSFENITTKYPLEFASVHTFFDKPFSKFYGFNHDEVQTLLTKIPEEQTDLDSLKLWYDGYNYMFIYQEKLHFYKPLSVIRHMFANKLEFPNYVFETNEGLIHKILSSDEMQEDVQSMIAGRSTWLGAYAYFASIVRWERAYISKVLRDNLTILIFNGLLGPRKANTVHHSDPNVGIPNKEMRCVYESNLMQWVYNKFNTTAKDFLIFTGHLHSGNKEQFAQSLQQYISKASAFIRSSKYNAKISYGGLMSAMKKVSTDRAHRAQDEKDNGDIRETNDILLIPILNVSSKVIAIRYKIIEEENNLTSVAEAELEQINKEYVNGTVLEIKYPHVERCFKLGIAFCDDKAEVRFEISERSTSSIKVRDPF